MSEPLNEELLFVPAEASYEIGALAEHVEQVEHTQHHGHVAGRQQSGQVLHRVVQVAREAVLDQQRRKLQHLHNGTGEHWKVGLYIQHSKTELIDLLHGR